MRGSDRSLVSAIRGPVTLITLGALFALNNFTPYQFHQTWPVLLIVFGLLTLMRRAIEPAPEPPPAGPIAYAPPYNYAPPPPPLPGTTGTAGGYRQSGYNEPAPPAGPAKGGFGSTAKPGETEGGTA
jgi:hypothetical protein